MCAIFASLAHALVHVHALNGRDYLRAKLDSEINARFLLNENVTYTFYCKIMV